MENNYQIKRRIGDIYWTEDEYRIGSPLSCASGKRDTINEKIILYLLDNVGKELTYEQISEASSSINPQSRLNGLVNQFKSSKQFKIIRRRGKVKLEKRLGF